MGAPAEASVHRWLSLPADTPMPLIERRRVVGEHLMISRVHLTKGFSVPSHRHANEQFACILSGRMRFGLGEEGTPAWREVVVGAGEVVVLPPDVPHSAEALEDSVLLDVFSPPSERTGVDRS